MLHYYRVTYSLQKAQNTYIYILYIDISIIHIQERGAQHCESVQDNLTKHASPDRTPQRRPQWPHPLADRLHAPPPPPAWCKVIIPQLVEKAQETSGGKTRFRHSTNSCSYQNHNETCTTFLKTTCPLHPWTVDNTKDTPRIYPKWNDSIPPLMLHPSLNTSKHKPLKPSGFKLLIFFRPGVGVVSSLTSISGKAPKGNL